ncbi:MAG: PAS domain-containing protein, partial [Fuerstiella sp.]|nr:PAS domain-containing protein [Fuerstiella sp.]
MFVRKGRPVSVASRLALKFLLLSTFTLTLASLFDIIPSPKHAEIRRKAVICESLAVTSSLLVQHQHDETLQKMFAATISRYPEILSACIRKQDGAVLLQIGDHDQHWHLEPNAPSTRENCYVPIKNGEQTWAAVEVSFAHDKGLFATLTEYPLVILGVFMVCVNGPLFRMYLSRTFKYLDPARSVPLHVRSTLDTFAEGVVVLDNDQKIVLANDKFRNYVGKTDHDLLGHHIDELPWEGEAGSPGVRWQVVDSSSDGIRMQLARGDNRRGLRSRSSSCRGGVCC